MTPSDTLLKLRACADSIAWVEREGLERITKGEKGR